MAAATDPQPRRRRALLVATGTYADAGLGRLRAPAGDVDGLAEVLGDSSIGRFEVEELVDRPTEEIKKAIEGFFAEGRPSDLLLLYFSGHGVLSQSRRFYFATASTSLEYLRATAIEDGFVNGVMQESRARSIVLVLDCCHSGAFGKGLTPKSGLTTDVEHRFEGRGRVTLSASTALEYAFEEEDPATGINELAPAAPGSLFTSCLVDGLRSGEADMDRDGLISVDELYDYVCDRVRERSPHQTPGMAGDRRGDIVIAHSTRRPTAPPPAPRRRRPPPRVRALVAGGAVAAAAVATALLVGGGSEPPGSAAPYDFDGDGRQEIVLGAARAIEQDGAVLSGAVVVHGGPEDESTAAITAEDAGVPGQATRSDRYGAALASGDFDRDGNPDLAIGVPGRDIATVVYGPPNATDRLPQLIRADALPSPPETGDFGFALLAADFTRDGYDDLAVGAPGTTAQRRNFELGSIQLIPGASGGLDLGRARRVEAPDNATGFGSSLAAGDIDRDRDLDLVTGSRDEPDIDIHGHLALCTGPPPLVCRRATSSNDFATSSLAVADVNDDTYPDVVQGDQGSEDGGPDFPNEAGAVRLWPGGESGLGGEPTDITQETRGIPGNAEDGDRFGHAVEAGDVDGDRVADIVIAAPGDEGPAGPAIRGRVTVIRGSPSVQSRPRAYRLAADGVEGDLGGSLSLLDLDGDGLDDLVVARENATSGDDAVVAHMREGNRLGPSVRLTGLDSLADLEESPLRIGR